MKVGEHDCGVVQCSTTLLDGKLDLKPKYAIADVNKHWKYSEKDHIK